MRIVHTSDWHLGRGLHGVDLLDHQALFLDHLTSLVREERIDAVLIAGDVYDRAIPPLGAVELLSGALAALSEHAEVVLTPGNHDSAVRLGFGAQLLRPGVHIRARVPDVGQPVIVPPRHGEGPGRRDQDHGLVVYALPYLDPDACRWVLAPVDDDGEAVPLPRSHAAVAHAAVQRVAADWSARRSPGQAAVIMAHAFVVGGTASDSERDIRVGGVDGVPAQILAQAGVDYVALGHLHRPQEVTMPAPGNPAPADRPTRAFYSGSPLAYSFSEANQTKTTITYDTATGVVEHIPCPVPRRLSDLTGTLENLLGADGEAYLDDWVRVTITDQARPADLYAQVRARFPHALNIVHRPPHPHTRERIAVIGPGREPVDVTAEFVEHITGAPVTPGEHASLRDAVRLAQREEA